MLWISYNGTCSHESFWAYLRQPIVQTRRPVVSF